MGRSRRSNSERPPASRPYSIGQATDTPLPALWRRQSRRPRLPGRRRRSSRRSRVSHRCPCHRCRRYPAAAGWTHPIASEKKRPAVQVGVMNARIRARIPKTRFADPSSGVMAPPGHEALLSPAAGLPAGRHACDFAGVRAAAGVRRRRDGRPARPGRQLPGNAAGRPAAPAAAPARDAARPPAAGGTGRVAPLRPVERPGDGWRGSDGRRQRRRGGATATGGTPGSCDMGTTTTAWATSCQTAPATTCVAGTWTDPGSTTNDPLSSARARTSPCTRRPAPSPPRSARRPPTSWRT